MAGKNKPFIDTKPIIISAMAVFVALIIIFAVSAMAQENKIKEKDNTADVSVTPAEELSQTPSYANAQVALAVVKEIDEAGNTIIFIDTDSDEEFTLSYTGATDVLDKYDKVLSVKQLTKGEIADVIYDGAKGKAYKIQISSKAWEIRGVSGLLVNQVKQVVSFLNQRYRYGDGILVIDGEEMTGLDGVVKRDVFTIRGVNQKVSSLTLTRGHGYLKLADADSFIGGNIYVGGKMWEQIVEDMMLTVLEGEYDVTVEFGGYSGTETITIPRNEVVTFYAGGYGPKVKPRGRVYFDIKPLGAMLYIDESPVSYEDFMELSYGLHSVEVSMGGYQSFKGTITIDQTENQFSISLSEGSQTEEPQLPDGTVSEGRLTPTPGADYSGNIVPEEEGNNQVWEPGSNEDNDNTSELAVWIDRDHTITISCTSGTEVYFDGTYVGEIENGKLVVPKYIGIFDIDLYLDGKGSKSYVMEIVDDKENVELSLPGF